MGYQKRSVLIIDDDEGVVPTITRLVQSLGVTVDYAYDLTTGLNKLNRSDVTDFPVIDLVFLDVNLPDGNGLDIIGDILTLKNS